MKSWRDLIRLKPKQRKENTDISREKQSLYGKTDLRLGVYIIQHPVLPNMKVFISFNEGLSTGSGELRMLMCI